MRSVVLQMMTTLNGRLDDPGAWVTGIDDEQYAEIDRAYGTFDTILIGTTTYAEMYAYWPGAETDSDGFAGANTDTNRSMARKMNTYKKVVFSTKDDATPLEWNNAERVVARSDDEVVSFVRDLKAQEGRDIHLAGGATLAQTFVRLGLVDEYHFFVYPLVSTGASWFAAVDSCDMELLSVTPFNNGVVGMYYKATHAR